jgi:hypothetical protein
MSIAEIERFTADLKSNDALRAAAEKAPADPSHATPVDWAVAFASSKGYAFTAGEVKAYVKAMAKASGRELTDAELVGVAGGQLTPEMTDRAQDDLKAKNLFLTQIVDIQAAMARLLQSTVTSAAKSIKG